MSMGEDNGFTDGNGRHVKVGDKVEYRMGGTARVLEIEQDGDATVEWINDSPGVPGTRDTVKWKNLALMVEGGGSTPPPDHLLREPFWMVYGERQGAPNRSHPSKASAVTEAKRLARERPGAGFFVLEAVAGYIIADPPVQELVLDPEFIPF